MAKTKVSVTLDPEKMAQARLLFGTPSLSELIDVALSRLIVDELERRHVAGYVRHPPEAAEDAWGDAERDPSGIADDVDWARLYGLTPPE